MSTFYGRNLYVTIEIESPNATVAKEAAQMIKDNPLTFSGIVYLHSEASPMTRCDVRGKYIQVDCQYEEWDIAEILIKRGLKGILCAASMGATVSMASTDTSDCVVIGKCLFSRWFSMEEVGSIEKNHVWYKPEPFINRHHYTTKIEENRLLPMSKLREGFNDAIKLRYRVVIAYLMRKIGFGAITLNDDICDTIAKYGGSIEVSLATTDTLFQKYAAAFEIDETSLKCIKRAAKEDNNIDYFFSQK